MSIIFFPGLGSSKKLLNYNYNETTKKYIKNKKYILLKHLMLIFIIMIIYKNLCSNLFQNYY